MAKVDLTVTTSAGTSYLAGTVTVTATPRPAVQVTRVEIYIDSVLVSTDTSDPYTYSWDTTTVGDGLHEIMAKAYFPRNQVTEKKLDVTVQNIVVEPPPPPIQDPPVNTTLPEITGTTTEGQRLSCSEGTWTNDPTNFSYQWVRCDAAGDNGVAIIGATGSNYVLVAADATKTIRCAVTAFNSIGNSAVATSAQTAVIAGLAPAVPVNSSLPVLTGTPIRGNVLSCSTGAWTNAPTSYTYQWRRCDAAGANCVNISSETASTYTVTTTDVTKTIRCGVIASNGAGSGTVAYSAATGVVAEPPTPPPPPPETDYDFRFATFNPATDSINGTFNKYSPPGYWWKPGITSPGGTWPSGGGLFEISTPYGPGIDIIVTQEMDYVGATPIGGWDLARFAGFHDTGYVWRGKKHIWEWTWMWPSAGNPSGWANTWVTAEGLTFPTLTPTGQSIVGHHLYLHYGNPMTLRFGRNTHVSSDPAQQAWQFYLANTSGVTFPANTYQHVRVEIFWTETGSGYIKVFCRNEGGSEIQWVNYSGVTLPTDWNPRSMYCNLRKISTHPRNQIHWINHRLTVV